MARLPIPGGDDNTWGNVLNSFLEVSLNSDGSISTTALQQAGGVTSINGISPSSGSVTLSTANLSDTYISGPTNNQVLSYDSVSGKWINQTPSFTAPVTSVEGMTGAVTGLLQATNNLSDLNNTSSARTNLGLGSAATMSAGAFVGTWQANTVYSLGVYIAYGGAFYVCITNHTSGSSFTGLGTNWSQVSPMLGPAPTGSGDDVPLQAYINAMESLNLTPVITQAGTYVLNNPVVVGSSGSGSIVFGDNSQTFQASGTFSGNVNSSALFYTPAGTAGTPYLDSPIWSGSPVFDANSIADQCVVLSNFSHFYWNGNPTFNHATSVGLQVGLAGYGSYGFKNAGSLIFNGPSHSLAPGTAAMVVNSTDCIIEKAVGGKYETCIVNGGADNAYREAHFSNTQILQGYLDLSGYGARYLACIGDTYAPVTHSSASGSSSSSTIADSAISTWHQGIRVTGTNIPSYSFVGTVTSGTSFTLVNAQGTPVTPTGSVSGITLEGVCFNLQGNYAQVTGGLSQNNGGVANGLDAIIIGPSTNVQITNHLIYGAAGTSMANSITGDLGNVTWYGVQQSDVTAQVASKSGVSASAFLGTSSSAIPSSIASTYGSAVTVSPNTNYEGFVPFGFVFTPSGVQAGETLSAKIVFNMAAGGTKSITSISATNSTTQVTSSLNNMQSLVSNGTYPVSVSMEVESSINSSTASAVLEVWGLNVG